MNEQLGQWTIRARALARWTVKQVELERLRESTLAAVPYVAAAGLVGLIAVAYAQLFLFSERWIAEQYRSRPWLAFVAAPAAFVGSWWLVARFAPAAGGSGIPQLMAAAELAPNPERAGAVRKLLGARVFAIKIMSSTVCILGGGAIGREGPTLQLAGSTFYLTNRLLTHRRLRESVGRYLPAASLQSMIITGGAAGLAAAFNTPLGGIVYAVEELAKVHLTHFRTSLIQAVIVSGLVAQWLLGPYLYLGYPKVEPGALQHFPTIFACGAAIGFLGALAGAALYAAARWRASIPTMRGQALAAAAAGLAFASLIYVAGEVAIGTGKETSRDFCLSRARTRSGTGELPGFSAIF